MPPLFGSHRRTLLGLLGLAALVGAILPVAVALARQTSDQASQAGDLKLAGRVLLSDKRSTLGGSLAFVSAPSGTTTSTTATISWVAPGGWNTYCDLDGINASCSNPNTYTGLKLGPHSFTVSASKKGTVKTITATWTVVAAAVAPAATTTVASTPPPTTTATPQTTTTAPPTTTTAPPTTTTAPPTTTTAPPTTTTTPPTTTTSPTPPPSSSSTTGVTPPTPPSSYTIPAGAKVLPDGTYGAQTITQDTYAAHLGGAIINGNVNFLSGSLHGVVVNGNINIASNTSPGVVTDSWIHAQGQSNGIYVYRPDGLDLERLVIDGFTNVGVRASTNTDTTPVIKRLWDLKITGGNQNGATGGTGEVALWVGQQVSEGVQRVDLSGAYTAALWTGNGANNTTFSDVKATNDVGPGTALYLEHASSNLVFDRFALSGQSSGNRTVQCEYVANFTQGACQTVTFKNGTVTGDHTGFDLEDAANVTISNVKFVGQNTGIYKLRCTGFVQSGNDFGQLAPGGTPVVSSG